ncbi:pseudouridine synthase [Vannielia litorea]|uniref:pseudouridine synthase n=1 Tax=Vannielia litorea TaxID=1217970 RepID=UPI001BCB6EB2|nr:pseudouridine synthase [Vannielia litorea]MBS8227637.1 pseudouridine synthase [Vannielia litorea]
MLLALNKPMNMLSQFTDEGNWPGLAALGLPKGVYPAGRLDRDSEGLLLLTDDGRLQARISSPKFKMAKTYWVLVEGAPEAAALEALKMGVPLKDGPTKRAEVQVIDEPEDLWPRDPPVRLRKAPDTWLALTIREGRNRQVRRMTAAVGHPTLRLIRAQIGPWALDGLAPGEWRELDATPPEPRKRRRKVLKLKR